MPQQSSKKLFFTFFLVFVFLNAFFWVASIKTTQAADTYSETFSGYACPKGCSPAPKGEGPDKRYIRLQIAIPGITDTCTYKVKTIQNGTEGDIKKQCHYVASNLPAFIQKAYSFSIGLIAIMAVIMIMIGGVKWILAAGNPGSIGDAQKTITAAVSGLVLALLSYAILNTINPNLTNLQMTNVQPVGHKEQPASIWCSSYPKWYDQSKNLSYVFYPMSKCSFGQDGCGIGIGTNYTFFCGEKYFYGYEEGIGGKKQELGQGNYCFGNYCNDKDNACINESGFSYCYSPKKLCEDTYKNNCSLANEAIDQTIKAGDHNSSFLNMSCIKRNDWGLIGSADQCVWNKRMFCPSGTERVSCLDGPKYDKSNITGCWYYDNGTKKPLTTKYSDDLLGIPIFTYQWYCNDDKYANIEANTICCASQNNNGIKTFKLYGQNAYVPDCSKVNKCALGNESSGQYNSEDALKNDPCHVCGF